MDLDTIFQGKLTDYKWKLLGEYLRSQRVHPGPGLTMIKSHSSGICIAAKKQSEGPFTQSPPFSVLSFDIVPDSDPKEYKVTLQEGLVVERFTQEDADAVLEHEPTIGGEPMSARPRPELTISDGDFIAVQYDTDDRGFVDGVPQIVRGEEEQSTHHQPPSGEGEGSPGFMWVKLLKFEVIDGAPIFTYFQQSDVEEQRLWVGKNIGEARYIHKQWNGGLDQYEFRTLKQVDIPSGRNGGLVIVPFEDNEFDDVNDAIKFSHIIERESDPQIRVTDDGEGSIEVKGNDNTGSLLLEDCFGNERYRLEWVDGLITSASATVPIPDCDSGGGS
jgi:hypothetical protein